MYFKLKASRRNMAKWVLILLNFAVINVIISLLGSLGSSEDLPVTDRQTRLLPTPRTHVQSQARNISQNSSLILNSTSIVSRGRLQVHLSQSRWLNHNFALQKSYCHGNVELFGRTTALFKNAVVDPSLAHPVGNKDFNEFYKFDKGLITVDDCSDVPKAMHSSINFDVQDSNGHIGQLNKAVNLLKGSHATDDAVTTDYGGGLLTVILTRFEYANVYWTVIDLYDVFLTMSAFNQTFGNTNLCILDGHPATPLDGLFEETFKQVFRLTALTGRTRFSNLVPVFHRKQSPILEKTLTPLPLVGEFRSRFMSSNGVAFSTSDARRKRCRAGQLNILFIWRRNYVAHPRNPTGVISRKISNEEELQGTTEKQFPNYRVTGVQLDKYPIRRQMELIGNSDITVGMHGAAFGYCILMQEGSGVVELWPKGSSENWHMMYIAKRNGLFYRDWTNTLEENENRKEKLTKVSASAVSTIIAELSQKVCSKY